MSPPIKWPKPHLEVADILRLHIAEYRNTYPLAPDQYRIVSHLLHCRTPTLGGHIERCTHCGAQRILYHSCRNRHCPKCQHIPREQWLEKRQAELLPTPYFHIVFTLPHELNLITLKNKSAMLNLLFKAVSETLIKFGKKELGGTLGFIAVLHTWDQQLKAHFHLHCLVPGGALCTKRKRWIACKENYLFNQEALSLVFRGKFIDHFRRSAQGGNLNLQEADSQLKSKLYKHKGVVSVRDPIPHAQHVLEYLARYTHRVAIANSRLLALKDGMVSFRYKDRQNNVFKQATLSAVDFIHRFLLHTLPQGFVRIRHYGFLANRDRTAHLTLIQRFLKCSPQVSTVTHSLQEMMLRLTHIDITLCPCCKKGRMQKIADILCYSGKHPYHFIRPPNTQALAPAV
jgi:Putative transposase/Transposase zinc-binding domain